MTTRDSGGWLHRRSVTDIDRTGKKLRGERSGPDEPHSVDAGRRINLGDFSISTIEIIHEDELVYDFSYTIRARCFIGEPFVRFFIHHSSMEPYRGTICMIFLLPFKGGAISRRICMFFRTSFKPSAFSRRTVRIQGEQDRSVREGSSAVVFFQHTRTIILNK